MTAAASALGDSYCLLAWGGKLGTASDAATAAGVLNGPVPQEVREAVTYGRPVAT